MKKKLTPIKKALAISGAVLGTIVLSAGGYVGYVILSYNRLGDMPLEIMNKSLHSEMDVNGTFKAVSYNLGFGAYSQDFTFFMDTGYDKDGNPTVGHHSKALSKDDVIFNINGAINTLKSIGADFMALQEVDTKSTRSYKIDQNKALQDAFTYMNQTHAVNFHTAYLPYPLYDMHGKVNAGLTTFSSYEIVEAERKEYTVSTSFSKFFDLDRCFSVNKIKVSNSKDFYFVNSHMSAYDEGGLIRHAQVAELNAFLKERKDNGDYVVLGGDFNHDLLTNNPDYGYSSTVRPFNETKKEPDWVVGWFDESNKSPIIDGYKTVASDNHPTCRNNDIEWDPNNTYTCVVDGFIVSDNIEIISHRNVMTKNGKKGLDGFAYSDHEPAVIEFKLK